MSLRNVLENLSEAGVSVGLGREGSLRIDSGASEEVKKLVRENKQALVDLCQAQEFVNAAGLRLVRMPMGGRGGDLCGERPETSPRMARKLDPPHPKTNQGLHLRPKLRDLRVGECPWKLHGSNRRRQNRGHGAYLRRASRS